MDTPESKTNDEWEDVPEDTKSSKLGWKPSPLVVAILLICLMGWIFKILDQHTRRSAIVHRLGQSVKKNAFQIHVGLTAYANSNEGVFPNETETGEPPAYSNDLLRLLFVKELVVDESLFHVNSHAIHAGGKPDGNIGTPENGYKEALGPGENAFDYLPGLTLDRDSPSLPILRTKLPDGQEVVVRIGGSTKVEKPGTSESLSAPQKWLLPTPVGAK